ncbi:hypothetical protein GJ496_006754 [Pomphorhynchus laevis]|nr:hypothetical protein GJ496_006754 [Pomphorhynchus laevis]
MQPNYKSSTQTQGIATHCRLHADTMNKRRDGITYEYSDDQLVMNKDTKDSNFKIPPCKSNLQCSSTNESGQSHVSVNFKLPECKRGIDRMADSFEIERDPFLNLNFSQSFINPFCDASTQTEERFIKLTDILDSVKKQSNYRYAFSSKIKNRLTNTVNYELLNLISDLASKLHAKEHHLDNVNNYLERILVRIMDNNPMLLETETHEIYF